jgi:hypothetical protein
MKIPPSPNPSKLRKFIKNIYTSVQEMTGMRMLLIGFSFLILGGLVSILELVSSLLHNHELMIGSWIALVGVLIIVSGKLFKD